MHPPARGPLQNTTAYETTSAMMYRSAAEATGAQAKQPLQFTGGLDETFKCLVDKCIDKGDPDKLLRSLSPPPGTGYPQVRRGGAGPGEMASMTLAGPRPLLRGGGFRAGS